MLSPTRREQLLELQEKLCTIFSNEDLIDQALTHSSYVNEAKGDGGKDNERLEFLGDAVLKLVVSSYLFESFSDLSEGDLTKIRAAVVSDLSLSEISRHLGLGNYLLLGKNELLSGGDKKKSNLANALEAMIAAIFIDGGLEKAKEIVIGLLKEKIENASKEGFIIDYKSAIQELSQKNKWGLPFYAVIKELGPKHKRIFWIDVKIKGKKLGSGRGYSKKEAEQDAAKSALLKLEEQKNTLSDNSIGDVISGILNRKKK